MNFFSRHFTHYPADSPDRPWFGIGPWKTARPTPGSDTVSFAHGKVEGIAIVIGRHGFAIHRSL